MDSFTVQCGCSNHFHYRAWVVFQNCLVKQAFFSSSPLSDGQFTDHRISPVSDSWVQCFLFHYHSIVMNFEAYNINGQNDIVPCWSNLLVIRSNKIVVIAKIAYIKNCTDAVLFEPTTCACLLFCDNRGNRQHHYFFRFWFGFNQYRLVSIHDTAGIISGSPYPPHPCIVWVGKPSIMYKNRL